MKKLLVLFALAAVVVVVVLFREYAPPLNEKLPADWPTYQTIMPTIQNNYGIISTAAIPVAMGVVGKMVANMKDKAAAVKDTAVKSILDEKDSVLGRLSMEKQTLQAEAQQLLGAKDTRITELEQLISSMSTDKDGLTKQLQEKSEQLIGLKDIQVKYQEALTRISELQPPNLH